MSDAPKSATPQPSPKPATPLRAPAGHETDVPASDPRWLAPAAMVDSDHPAVQAFARQHAEGRDDRQRAVALYYAVRDQFLYDPYRTSLSEPGMKGSTVISNGYGWCIPKAALLAGACRAAGIPARLGFADVRNHLSTERMRQFMGTDTFFWHGYTEIWLDGAWRKATPAFNLSLTERFGLLPLEFDGVHDSIYHPFDRAGQRHMEYLAQRGSYADIPLAHITADFGTHYPAWMAQMAGQDPVNDPRRADFLAEVDRENARGGTAR